MRTKISVKSPTFLFLAVVILAAVLIAGKPGPGSFAVSRDQGSGLSKVTGFNPHAYLSWMGPGTCLMCHPDVAYHVHESVHYQWLGEVPYMTHGPDLQGKLNGLNSYCISILGNWTGCSDCHVGRGLEPEYSPTPTPAQLENIDCLLCHQKEYKRVRGKDGIFIPDTASMSISMDEAVRTLHMPERINCLQCHARAGGGDAYKRGDLALAVTAAADRDYDVHMATTGADLLCQDCHIFTDHRVIGRGSDLRPNDSGELLNCSRCHPDKLTPTGHAILQVNWHVQRVACQTCHIPFYAKRGDNPENNGTEIHRDWTSTPDTQPPFHPKIVTAFELIPKYKFWDRYNTNYVLYDTVEIDPETGCYPTSRPQGGIDMPGSKIYPFKYKTAVQPITEVSRQLIALDTGLYKQRGDAEAAAWQGLLNMHICDHPQWVCTDTYQLLNHQVSPASMALNCFDCHYDTSRIDLKKMGYVLRDKIETLCSLCHKFRPNPGFEHIHKSHVHGFGFDCMWCHNFSRPERGLKASK
jgi:hypothetical protein